MSQHSKTTADDVKPWPYVIALAVVWTLLIAASIIFALVQSHREMIEVALTEARSSFEKDITYRRWVSGHGGVYVPATDKTPPNPFLYYVPERDITTPSGRHLTLINSSDMTRQVYELGREAYGDREHLVSLNPINPINSPDSWEAHALKSFEIGAKEVYAVKMLEDKPYLRFMRPVVTEKSCLKCHAAQGYKEGDIRGGISILQPLEGLIAERSKNNLFMSLGLCLFWLLGFSGIGFTYHNIQKRIIANKRVETDMRDAKEQLEKFVEHSIDPIVMGDSTGHVAKPNKAFLDMLGYAEEEIIGKKVHSLSITETGTYESTTGEMVTITEDFFRESLAKVKQFIEAGKISSWESYYTHKSGKIIPVTQNNILLYDDNGNRSSSFSIIRDLTHQKKAEAALWLSEEHFRAITESSMDAIITSDTQNNIIFCNPAAERMYGYSKEELIGKPAALLAPERLRERNKTSFQNTLKKEVPHLAGKPLEVWGLRKDKQEFPAEVSVTRYKIDDKLYFTATVHDITERKKLEEQIRQSQKMEAIGTLAGGIAHDFNNILAAIIGYTEMSVQNQNENASIKHNLEQVLKSSYRARDLIKQILMFSRKSIEERKPVEITPLIKETIKLLRASIPTTIEIREHLNDQAGIINADPTQIHQILMNLCTNAAHAMSDSGGVLEIGVSSILLDAEEITAYPELQPGTYLKLSVRDTGSGVDPAIIDRIFEPYFTTKEVGQGTGMGLAVVHGIVKSYGGATRVKSEPGKGTIFNVLLPEVEEKMEKTNDEVKVFPTGNECILYVDDEEALIEMGQEMLEYLGYKVITKKSSIEALEEFKKDPDKFDMVITDQTMPAMTGIDLATQVMSIRPDIPVILCTGNGEHETRQKAPETGIREFIIKPFNLNKLADAVRTVLDNKPA